MEKEINWYLNLSLEQMALRRVAANVWMESDILALIKKRKFEYISDEYIQNEVNIKISKLMLPESCKKQIIYLTQPMGSYIHNWKSVHEHILLLKQISIPILKQLCWTNTGVIDYRNTAERLICLEIFSVPLSYELACAYCLVDYIKDLWKKMPQDTKQLYYDGSSCGLISLQMTHYWPYFLNEEDSKLDEICRNKLQQSFYHHAFTFMACKGNKAATEWFFQKLPQVERNSKSFRAICDIVLDGNLLDFSHSNRKLFPTEKYVDVVHYLLSLMSSDVRMRVLKAYPCEILACFLYFPWQHLFLEIADVVWTFLPESRYNDLLSLILKTLRNMHNYFPNFQEFFLHCPSNFRKHLLFSHNRFFPVILRAEDTETIQVIFRNVDVEDRVRFVFSSRCFEWLEPLIMTDKWHLVELCIREATMSNEEMKKLKVTIMNKVSSTYHEIVTPRAIRLRKRKWMNFFQFLDATTVNSHKRGYEGDMMNETKKLCIEKEKTILPIS